MARPRPGFNDPIFILLMLATISGLLSIMDRPPVQPYGYNAPTILDQMQGGTP